jgi:hypothetical protein
MTIQNFKLDRRKMSPFLYFCFLLADKASLTLFAKRKQKYQNGNIDKKLTRPCVFLVISAKSTFVSWFVFVGTHCFTKNTSYMVPNCS